MARIDGSGCDWASSRTAMLSDAAFDCRVAVRPCAQPDQWISSPGTALATPSSPPIRSPLSSARPARGLPLLLLLPVRVQAVPPPLLRARGGDGAGHPGSERLQLPHGVVGAEPHALELTVELHG